MRKDNVRHASERFKVYAASNNSFYLYVVSVLTFSVRARGVPVYQLFLRKGKEYGVTFNEMVEMKDGVSMVPTCFPTQHDLERCARALKFYPPVCGHSFSADGGGRFHERVKRFFKGAWMEDGGALVLKGGAARQPETRAFVSMDDGFLDDIRYGILGLCNRAEYVAVRPEYFSDKIYGICIEVAGL